MNIIKNIGIKNYKSLEGIDFPCESINIIIGPNNTGKSSVLQSIWMAVSSLNEFEDILGNELSEIVGDEGRGRYLINQGKKRSKIELEISDNKKITLDLKYLEKGYPEEFTEFFLNFINQYSTELLDVYSPRRKAYYSPKGLLPDAMLDKELYVLSREVRRIGRLSEKGELSEKITKLLERITEKFDFAIEKFRSELINTKKLFITSRLDGRLIAVNVMMTHYTGEIPINQRGRTVRKIPLLINSQNIEEDISELYEKLVKTKKLAAVIDKLTERIPYFEDIREVEGDLVVILKDKRRPLPISLMGDGFKSLLKLSFMAPLIKKGIVLFEEPETAMHPGYLDILAEEIISSSKNSQFFVSTHSLELVEYFLEKAGERDKLDSINIIRMRRDGDGHISREVLGGKEAKEEMEGIRTDLRGY